VLVLDLYMRQGTEGRSSLRTALRDALSSLAAEARLAAAGTRKHRSVKDKLLDFAGLDPEDATTDRLAVDAPECAIWDEFAGDRALLRFEARAIRARLYDVVAFLQARTEPIEDPHSGARFRIIQCTPATTTYRRVRARVGSDAVVPTAALQEILNEVLDRAHGHRTFLVEVPTRFQMDHGKLADAVIAAMARHVFELYDGFGKDIVDPMFDTDPGGVADAALARHVFESYEGFGNDTPDSTLDSDPEGGTGAPPAVRGSESVAGAPGSAELGTGYLPADELAAVAERDPFPTDPDLIERGTRSHARLQNQLAAEVASAGLVPLSPAAGDPPFDLAWRDGDKLQVAEVKSTTATNEEHQLRLGLGQLLRYRHTLSANGATVLATLYVERKPADPQWSELCESLDVTLRWPTP
jgi:hypothetical protein